MAGSCDGCRSRLGHSHFTIIEKHAIHLLDGLVGGLLGLEVDKSIALRAVLITNHLLKERQRASGYHWPGVPAGTEHLAALTTMYPASKAATISLLLIPLYVSRPAR